MIPPDPFYGTSGPHDAKIVIVGESWGSDEDMKKAPFVGMSGQELTRILSDAGINREDCLLTNVVPEHPPGNDVWRFFYPTGEARKEKKDNIRGLYPRENVMKGLINLYYLIQKVNPKLVIGFGNYTLWALTEDNFGIGDESGHKIPTGITSWRGSQLYCRSEMGGAPFLPTYHPAAVMRQWSWRYTVVHDLKMRVPKAFKDEWTAPNWDFILRPSFNMVMAELDLLLAQACLGVLRLAVDLETRHGFIACCGLAWSKLNAICIPFMCIERDDGYWTVDEQVIIIKKLHDLLQHPAVCVIGQNFSYDAQYIANEWQFAPHWARDTMTYQYIIWPGTPKGLSYLSSLYCEYHCHWKEEGKDWNAKMPEEQLWAYNCKDAVATFEADEVLVNLAEKMGQTDQCEERMQVDYMAFRMMMRGVNIDKKHRARLAIELGEAMQPYEKDFELILNGREWGLAKSKTAKPWYRSPIQQIILFYDVLGLPIQRHKKTKRPTVEGDALTVLARKEPILRPIFQMLEEYRSLGVFFNTFVNAPLDIDDRMRCSFDNMPETFRWSSSKNAFGRGTNLQNIPPGTED